MITGNIDHFFASPSLKSIIEFSLESAQNQIAICAEDGKYEIIEDKLFFILATIDTKEKEQCRPEFHQNFADIQLILSGQEKIGYSNQPCQQLMVEDRLKDNDVAFCSSLENEQFIHLKEGDFAIFLPGQGHRPGTIANDKSEVIKKAVIKIHKDLFQHFAK